MTEPWSCAARWESAPERVCGAREVEHGEGRCLVHHPRWREYLQMAVDQGRVDLSHLEIMPAVVAALHQHLDTTRGFRLECPGSTFVSSEGFSGATFRYAVTFAGATFSMGTHFNNSVFADRAVFRRVDFGPHVGFESATFESDALFEDAAFGDAHFERATFKGWAIFERATLDRGYFESATFASTASFREADVGRAVYFQLATFESNANFDGLDHGKATLHGVSLGSSIRLGSTPDGSPVHLSQLHWSGPVRIDVGTARVALDGRLVRDPVTLSADPSAGGGALVSMQGCTLLAPVIFDGAVDLAEASFAGTTGLEQLRFSGNPGWARTRTGRQVLHDDVAGASPALVEPLYRQLRAGLEASKAAPAAADFYYGELEARRKTAGRGSIDRILLPAYKWIGGYGVRAWRPFAWYLALVVGTAFLIRYRTGWFVESPHADLEGFELWRFWDALAFVARNSVSVFSAPASGLTAGGTLLLVTERFAAVTLLALTVLAVRSRVHR